MSLFFCMFLWHTTSMHNIYMAYICTGERVIPINTMKTLLLIDRLSKDQLETLLTKGSVMCDDQVFALGDLKEEGRFKEPYRTALVLKVLGKTTGALLCALGFIDCEEGAYGRMIGQELGKDDNYIRQLLNILECMEILHSSEGKGKQRVFTLQEDLILLPRGQLKDLLQGKAASMKSLTARELEEGHIHLEELFAALYDAKINQIISHREWKEKFEVGQLIESMIKSGVVRTFETSSSKRLHHEGFLSFYQLLELLNTVRQRIPLDEEGNVTSADLTRVVGEELQKRDETGELARRYRDYVQYRMRKQIVTEEGSVSIDFPTLKDLIDKTAQQKGIDLSGKMRNLLAEDLITSLKGLPITSFKAGFIESFIDNLLEDRFLITSSEKMMNQAETLMRVGERLLANAQDFQHLDTVKAREYTRDASLSFLSLLLFLYSEVPPQKLSLMTKAFLKKKGEQSIFTLLVEDFSSVRKDKNLKETEDFLKVKNYLEEKFGAFDVARFLRTYLKIHIQEDFQLVEFIESTGAVASIGKLLFELRKSQMEG